MAANREDKHLSCRCPSVVPFRASVLPFEAGDMVTNNQSVDDFPILISDWHSARLRIEITILIGDQIGDNKQESTQLFPAVRFIARLSRGH